MRGLDLYKKALSILLLQLLLLMSAHAESQLPRLLDSTNIQDVFPGATRTGSVSDKPVVAPVYRDTEQLGFVFLTSDYVNSTGYSGKPIHQLVAIDMQGVIRKVTLVEHHEPIVLIGIPESRITAILKEYEGMDVGQLVAGSLDHSIDVVSGATVTVMVMDDNILLSSIKVARHFGLAGLKKPLAAVSPPHTSIARLMTSSAGKHCLMKVRSAISESLLVKLTRHSLIAGTVGFAALRKKARRMRSLLTCMRHWCRFPVSAAACWVSMSTEICRKNSNPVNRQS